MEDVVVWFHRRATHFVEAQLLFHLNQVGVFSALAEAGPCSSAELASRLSLDPRLLETVLSYVAAVDDLLVVDAQGRYQLSEFGRAVMHRFGRNDGAAGRVNLFDVRVGCYEPVWSNVGRMLRGEARYGTDVVRNGAFAEDGVFALSRHFVSSIEAALTKSGAEVALEIGVSSGLPEMLIKRGAKGAHFGLDRSPTVLELAAKRASVAGANVGWLEGDFFKIDSWVEALPKAKSGLVYSIHFHELMARGEVAVADVLRELAARRPGWHVLALEQPLAKPDDRERLGEVGWLYAHSNVLIHHLIGNGRILPDEGWKGLMQAAGATVLNSDPVGYLGYRGYLARL